MKKRCFICGQMMMTILSNGESIFRPDGAAHMDCLWNAAKLIVYGEMEPNNVEDE